MSPSGGHHTSSRRSPTGVVPASVWTGKSRPVSLPRGPARLPRSCPAIGLPSAGRLAPRRLAPTGLSLLPARPAASPFEARPAMGRAPLRGEARTAAWAESEYRRFIVGLPRQRAAPLCASRLAWSRLCAPPPFLMDTISRGHPLQFASSPPPFRGVVESTAHSPQQLAVLESEIAELLSKQAIRLVPPSHSLCGWYSRYFLVQKRQGGFRPILDLSPLNGFIKKKAFRMLSTTALKRAFRQGDFCTSIDLKDAFFHVPILEEHKKYLRFSFRGRSYEFNVLPFGYSLAPRTFALCVRAALAPLRREGIRVLDYLDDLLLLASSEELARAHTVRMVNHLSALGLAINWEKSSPWPARQISYLGLSLDTQAMTASLSPDRREDLRLALSSVTPSRLAPVGAIRRLLGLMSAAHSVVHLGLLHMRPLQRWLRGLLRRPEPRTLRPARVPPSLAPSLSHWSDPSVIARGSPLGRVSDRVVVFTDASLSGWGGVCGKISIKGQWPRGGSEHINHLELHTVLLVLSGLGPHLVGRHVLVRSDNQTTVSHINRQGGVRSLGLHRMAHEIWLWASANLLSLEAQHVAGRLNTAADLMSRGGPRAEDWSLNPRLAALVWSLFGTPQVDLFATERNHKCDLWFSLFPSDNPPLGLDALAHPWPDALLYAFPPVRLIPSILDRIRDSGAQLILVAPLSPSAPWMAELHSLVHSQPLLLPDWEDALSQADGEIFSRPRLHGHRLAAWKLNASG